MCLYMGFCEVTYLTGKKSDVKFESFEILFKILHWYLAYFFKFEISGFRAGFSFRQALSRLALFTLLCGLAAALSNHARNNLELRFQKKLITKCHVSKYLWSREKTCITDNQSRISKSCFWKVWFNISLIFMFVCK